MLYAPGLKNSVPGKIVPLPNICFPFNNFVDILAFKRKKPLKISYLLFFTQIDLSTIKLFDANA